MRPTHTAFGVVPAHREIIRLESDQREDQLALLRWADDGGYCPPDPEDAAVDRGLALVTLSLTGDLEPCA